MRNYLSFFFDLQNNCFRTFKFTGVAIINFFSILTVGNLFCCCLRQHLRGVFVELRRL